MGLKKNLYYEIKDVVQEERQDGVHAYKHKVRTKVYGLNSTKTVRRLLIDILIERVENHKDKIISPIIYNELLGMEVKRNGKVEHSTSTHDDQVFSMLMALYVWYEGTNLAERFGIKKTTIKTDDEVDEQLDFYNDETVEIVAHFNQEEEIDDQLKADLNMIMNSKAIEMKDFIEKREEEERNQFNQLINTPEGERAYRQMYNIPDNVPISNVVGDGSNMNVPDSAFYNFYQDTDNIYNSYNQLMNRNTAPEGEIETLNDGEYNYLDHFNF